MTPEASSEKHSTSKTIPQVSENSQRYWTASAPIHPNFIVGMESAAHYWLALYSALRKRGYTVHVLNPIQSNALRGMYIRQVKNDERDSFIIAEVIRFGRYTQGGPPPCELYELRELCRARSFIVDMTADLKRKVIALSLIHI